MRQFIYIWMLTAILTCLSSCEKFLDVNPKTEMKGDVLFNSEQGFKDALTGVYIEMTSSSSYGEALSQGTIESLISSWVAKSGTVESVLGTFNYTHGEVMNRFDEVFKQQYKTIALINGILKNIDTKRSIFKDPKLYALIKAEALALRALIHLDLLRLYGPIPADPSVGNQLAYVTAFSNNINGRLSFEQYQKELFQDIEEALSLSKEADPFLQVSMAQMRRPSPGSGFNPVDDFFAYRYLKMNYYAVKGLEARAHLWFGQKEKALAAAVEIIEAKNENGSLKFPLATSADFASRDYVLTKEHLFGLYDYQMYDKYLSKYRSGQLNQGAWESTVKNTLYGSTGSDMRESSLWNMVTLDDIYGSKVNVIRKYEVADPKLVSTETDYKQIPMLRTSEMYLIAAECAPFSEGVEYLKKFYIARNKANTVLPANEGRLLVELIKEYRREFFAEGQAFYNYKRNESSTGEIIFAPYSATANYLLPMPRVENVNK